mmetsp:Transcript_4591/g.14579  ORF Transcript_4591/g.14579 Transcript_4591/m.14579 type:complete len:243 (-) Transcript_4591:105-833(-)
MGAHGSFFGFDGPTRPAPLSGTMALGAGRPAAGRRKRPRVAPLMNAYGTSFPAASKSMPATEIEARSFGMRMRRCRVNVTGGIPNPSRFISPGMTSSQLAKIRSAQSLSYGVICLLTMISLPLLAAMFSSASHVMTRSEVPRTSSTSAFSDSSLAAPATCPSRYSPKLMIVSIMPPGVGAASGSFFLPNHDDFFAFCRSTHAWGSGHVHGVSCSFALVAWRVRASMNATAPHFGQRTRLEFP